MMYFDDLFLYTHILGISVQTPAWPDAPHTYRLQVLGQSVDELGGTQLQVTRNSIEIGVL